MRGKILLCGASSTLLVCLRCVVSERDADTHSATIACRDAYRRDGLASHMYRRSPGGRDDMAWLQVCN